MRSAHKICVLVIAAAALLNCGGVLTGGKSGGKNSRATVAEVSALTAEQLATAPLVLFRGTITYGLQATTLFFVDDGTGGIRVDLLAPDNTGAQYGDEVEVNGVPVRTGRTITIGRARFRRLGKGRIPAPSPATLQDLNSGRFENKMVMVTGTLMSSETSRETVRYSSRELHVEVEGRSIVVRTEDNKKWSDAPIDSEVRVTGVATTLFDARGLPTRSILWANGFGAFEYTSKAIDPLNLPLSHVRELIATDPARLPAHRIRLRGQLQGAGSFATLEDESGRIAVWGLKDDNEITGAVDLAGFAIATDGLIRMEDCKVMGEHVAGTTAKNLVLPMVTRAADIHAMTRRDAARGYPVKLTGVVTFHNLHDNLLFVQDDSDGIFVWSNHLDAQLHAGDAVEVRGKTSGGGFAPTVAQGQVRILGRTSMPSAARGMEEAAFLGHLDSRWVEIRGVVQSVKKNVLTIAWGTHTFQANVYLPKSSPAALSGATVTIRGVAAAVTNNRRQLLGLLVQIPSEDFIEVVRRGPEDPFEAPLQSASDLLVFSPKVDADRRAKVRGVVTLAEPTGTTWIRDASGGIEVQPRLPVRLAAGDEIEASGLPMASGYSVALRDADIRKAGSGHRPAPILVDPAAGFRPEFDSQLVQIDATALNDASGPDGRVLVMQAGSVAFQARIASLDGNAGELPKPGALLRLTGVYSVDPAQREDSITRSFRLIVGSTADIQVLKGVPWWTPARLLAVILVSLAIIVAVAGWVLLLRREVRARVAQAENALDRAIKAEQNQSRQKEVLDLIARDETLETVLSRVSAAVSALSPELSCTVSLVPVESAPGTPDDSTDASIDPSIPGLSVPILVNGQIRGSIDVFASSQQLLQRMEPEIGGTWQNLAAMAIERHDLYGRLSFRAAHDTLTELANRLAFSERLDAEVAQARATGSSFALSYIDVDRFKDINDTFGHDVGDVVLREISVRIRRCLRQTQMAARLGGDEFIVLMPGTGERRHAQRVAADISAALREPIVVGDSRLTVGASIGISLFPEDGDDAASLLRAADLQMYQEKHLHREHQDSPVSLHAIAQATEVFELV